MRLGIYIHFPWCRNRCPYCDFAIALAPKGPPHQRYLEAVLAELAYRAELYDGKELVSIYFGGGTPSLWEPSCLATLIDTCCQRFAADKSRLEISLECNPSDCTEDAFSAWRGAGINRLLIGVQATNASDLVTLGRDHAMGDGLAALTKTLNAGFASVGADVILGVPGVGARAGTSSAGLASLRDVASLGPQHISAYELTIEERTPFAKMVARGELVPENEDRLASIYLQAHEILGESGYQHYEVSSYCLPGARAVHNSLYWQGADYLGLGNGAASLLVHANGAARRSQNRRSAGHYLNNQASQHVDFSEEISAGDFARERLWLAMRTTDGVADEACEVRAPVWRDLENQGLIERVAGRIRPTIRGFLYNNQLISRLGID